MTSSSTKKSRHGHPSSSSSRKQPAPKGGRRLECLETSNDCHQHIATSNNRSQNTTYMPPTHYGIPQHDAQQMHLHETSTHALAYQQPHNAHLSDGLESLDIHLPSNLQGKVTKHNIGILPMEHFQASNTYPYQQHNTYNPLTLTQSSLNADYHYSSSTTYHQPSTNDIYWGGNPSASRGGAYYIPQASCFPPTATNQEYAITGVGSQFDVQPRGEYDPILHTGS